MKDIKLRYSGELWDCRVLGSRHMVDRWSRLG